MVIDKEREGRESRRNNKRREKIEENKEDSAQSAKKDYYPPSPIYDPTFKEDTMAALIVKRQDLNPNYYPPKYQPNCEKDAPTLVDNLVAPSVKTKEEKKGEDTKAENKGEDTKEENRGYKTQAEEEDSEEDIDGAIWITLNPTLFIKKNTKERNIRIILYDNL